MDNENSSLTEFVKSTINQIKGGLSEGFKIKENIEFELQVVSVGEKQGNLDLRILKLGGATNNQEIQKIKFSVTDNIDLIKVAQENLLKKQGLLPK
ncbi:MAG: hypothetical protein PHN22_04805 [Candidatus ainarchaeum sp.]|nr:hypothetical protein [Candidatus ainarchaeum sp.]